MLGGEPRREGSSRGPAQYLRAASCATDGQLRRCSRRDDRHQVSRRGFPDRQYYLGERFVVVPISGFPNIQYLFNKIFSFFNKCMLDRMNVIVACHY